MNRSRIRRPPAQAHLLSIIALLASVAAAAPPAPLMLWDCDRAPDAKGVSVVHDNVKQGDGAVRWTNHTALSKLSVPNVPTNWTGYNLLRLRIYSAKSVPTRIMVIIDSQNPTTEGADYWGYGVPLNFTGWRELVFPIGGKDGARSPRGWDQIDGMAFVASGWGNTPHPDADILLDDIRLEYDAPRPGPRMSDAEFFDALELSRPALDHVRRAVASNDLARAKQAFLDYMRTRKHPVWWLDWRDRPRRPAGLEGGSDGWDYFAARVKVDWTGWKLLTLPLNSWTRARKPIGWHYITSLRFSATYGDRVPSPDTELVFDDVTLTGTNAVSLGHFESDEDAARWHGLTTTTNHVHGGKQAGLWSHLPSTPGLSVSDAPRDWSGFNALRLWVHSSKATGDIITLTADSEPPSFAAADAILRHIYDGYHLGDDIDWRTNKRDPADPAFTREWTYSLNRFPHWRTLGRAYWDSGNETYAREWIAQMRDWVEDNPYLLHGTGNSTLTWRTIEAGIRCSGSWPDSLQYFLGSPSLHPDDLVMFMKSWIEHAHHLMRITVEHPEHGGNWVTMECNGLGHLGILFPECKDAPTWLRTAIERLSLELDRQVYPDGAQKELTTGYHQVARGNFVGLYKLAQPNKVPIPPAYLAKIERMYDYNLRAMMPDGTLPPLNDAGFTRVTASLKEGAELFGRDDFRWAATGGANGTAPGYTSVAFPYAGQYVMRSGWQPDDLYMLFESGPFGIGHQHEDKLSMILYGLGRVLLTEAGTYSYDQSKYRRYVLGTWAHNTALVDGLEQHRGGLRATYETDQPLDNLWMSTPRVDAADGVYQSGYGPNRIRSVTHERTVVFVRHAYWVVVDRFHADGEHRYDVLWHLNNDDAARDPQTLAAWGTDAGVANLMVTPVTPAGLTLDIVKGREDPVLGFAPASRHKPIPVLDYRLKAAGPASLAWILTPFREQRPDVHATREGGDDLTLTVTNGSRTDTIHIAPRSSNTPPETRIRVTAR